MAGEVHAAGSSISDSRLRQVSEATAIRGRFLRIIVSSILTKATGTYNITGQERIDYIDLIRAVKKATGAKSSYSASPYSLFWALLKITAQFDKNPAFTVGQLKALITPDVFEVIDWPGIFNVRATPLQ